MPGKIQMQGRSVATGALVPWLADTPDYAGALAPVPVTDAVVYTRAGLSVATVPIVCTILEPTSLAAMVGVNVLITGRISRPGTVALAGLGAATVSGLTWSYLFAPSSAGSLPISVTATDATNGSTSTASITLTVAAAATFPGTVTPLARMQHDAPAFQDLAGSTPAVLANAPVRRVNNVSPLAGYWQTNSAARRDTTGVCIEPSTAAVGDYPLQFISGPGTSINLNDSTFVCTWIQRYGDFTLCIATGANPQWGVTAQPLSAFINNVQASLGLTTVLGARHTLACRWTPTGLKVKLLINGSVVASTTISATITSGNPGAGELRVGHFQSFAYGTVSELLVVNRAVSDTEADQLLSYADSIPLRPAFPIDQPLIAATGDSNVVGVGVEHGATWKFLMLKSLRAAWNAEMLCTALVGTNTAGHAGYIAPYYDARRKNNVAIFEAGTNDIANGYGVSAVLPVVQAQIASMHAQGWKTIVCTIPDRQGLLGGGVTQSFFDTQRAAYNSAVLAGQTGADAIADLGGATHLGAVGDALNGTYFLSDFVHLLAPAQAIAAPLITTAVQSLLAA